MLDFLTPTGEACIYAIFGVLTVMSLSTAFFMSYRSSVMKRVKDNADEWGKELIFHSPDDSPRRFLQYGYRSSVVGSCVVYSWIVMPLVGYVIMAYCAMYPFGPIYEVPKAFGSWDGIMFPWCVLFTVVHVLLGIMSKFYQALRARSLMPVDSLYDATHVVIDEDFSVDEEAVEDPDEEGLGSLLHQMRGRYQKAKSRAVVPIQEEDNGTRYISYTCVRYVYKEDEDCFFPEGIQELTPQECHERVRRGGLTHEEAADALARCGTNAIHVHVPSVVEALATEFFDFTYIFNSIGTWSYIGYSAWNIGYFWLLMIIGSGLYRALGIIRPNIKKIREMAEMEQESEVLREGKWVTVDVSEIALGDVVKIQDGNDVMLPVDGTLTAGSLVVNESMLTGEPMPIAKAPVDNSGNATVTPKLNVAYAGTLSLESTGPGEGKSIIVATNIGALTTRGQLVRMVLFPTTVKFKYNDQLPLVYALLCVYMVFLIIILTFFTDMGSVNATYMSVLNTVAMCISPMLPVSLVMGQSVSATRLEDKTKFDIKCLQPGRIPIAGKISTMVFDKTGTITKGGMDFAAVIPVAQSRFGNRVDFDYNDPESDANAKRVADNRVVPDILRHALATCHTVKQLQDGRLVGNSVECAMVRTCGWKLDPPRVVSSATGETLTVVRQLEFDHHRMTSGAVAMNAQGGLEVFIKGSYEKIQQVSNPPSVPADYTKVTSDCAKQNYYTLGIATKMLPPGYSPQQIADMPRDELERGVDICGLLLFRNEIKIDSAEAIQQLRDGGIRSVICTGDNELTGIAIGRLCGIVQTRRCLKGDVVNGQLVWTDPDDDYSGPVSPDTDQSCQLAVTYKAWRHLLKEKNQLGEIWTRLVVFARMKPDDKINVVKYLQGRGLVVGMAGDGGNDCGGLRAAHAGIALSDAEASMVSPFSTGRLGEGSPDITLCTVPDLIREGRACLATNLATFQYFMVYSFTLTALRTFLVVYATLSMGEWVWMTMDVAIGICMMYFMTQSGAADQLASYRPTATLLGPRTLAGIFFPVFTGLLAFFIALGALWSTDWYDYLNPTKDIHVLPKDWMRKGDNYDSAIGMLVLITTLTTTAYVNTYGGLFRENIIKNIGLNVFYFAFCALLFFLTMTEPNTLSCIFRVNCDTNSSLGCGDIPIMAQYSAGGTGGCFLGPQVQVWQDYASSVQPQWSGVNGSYWQPKPDQNCLPDAIVLKEYPYDDTMITTGMDRTFPNCYGPNNCFSPGFKWTVAAILLIFIGANHFFTKFVLLGPVAAKLRARQRAEDGSNYGPLAAGADSSEEDSAWSE
eukprot:TRINITY_DN15027_c1_g1_i1.p1 TRINITY_DN15027_c1_g1~~TRINITY_DN15027_c1_g1_i1.p1  ORF type:complete len:1307 (-),score=256.90 TRINITY_DN15027_c1_g1_i1:267-4187(-)